jgi:two-component system, OmpR family, sensor histidine kinase KdpD
VTAEPARPDPDALLLLARDEAARAARARLRIYFGANAGVGKTYAMLRGAQALKQQGVDVVVGLVETHGRAETQALLAGLELLPRRPVARSASGANIDEFDVNAALARKPAVMLVDELAHSNAPGSRHPKRWQDIDELRAAGIEVHTTVNVQHLESLNDVVGGITQIRVCETVPDHVFDEADEVVLVDLPPDDLLQRLKEGKVYHAEQAERAAQHFFRKSNLIALRELALRRTADRVDDEVRSYRRELGRDTERPVWPTADAMLVAVGPQADNDKLVRTAARRAGRSDAPWHAVFVETPASHRLPQEIRRAALQSLKLAESLGAITATLAAPQPAQALVAYAREHNLGTIVIGRREGRPAWQRLAFWGFGVAPRVARLAPDIDLTVVGVQSRTASAEHDTPDADEPPTGHWPGYGWAAAGCALTTLLCMPLHGVFELANIVMLFLLTVMAVAWRHGHGPAVFAAAANVLAFDFFFVPPRYSFAVGDFQYLLTFAVMLGVGTAIGQLTASLRHQLDVSRLRENRARSLYEMARELGSALQSEQVAEIADRHLEAAFRGRAAVLLAEDGRHLGSPSQAGNLPAIDAALAQWCLDHGAPAGLGTGTLPASPALYVPLAAPMRVRGVLVLQPREPRTLAVPEQRRLIDTYAALIGIAVERVHFVAVAQDSLLGMESERLRNALLAALSHDLRTPLTALLGGAETLADALDRSADPKASLARSIVAQARRTTQMVANLLEMARLQAGAVTLKLDWLSLEELVGSARRSIEAALHDHPLVVNWPTDLPLFQGDAVLIERVLVNLLENAAKHTPAGTPISVSARVETHTNLQPKPAFVIEVADEGPGLPPGRVEAMFESFERADKESTTPGVGLGLAICRAIMQAHGGDIRAASRIAPAHGAVFTLRLPYREPPALEESES